MIKGWKNMPRKEQELVLRVWESVLETIKFNAASKDDFGVREFGVGAGVYKPKDTPFDIALQALQELCGTPLFTHACPGCVFLGTTEKGYMKNVKSVAGEMLDGPFDLYFCSKTGVGNPPTLTARFKDAPKPTDLASSINEVLYEESLFGVDRGFCAEPANKITQSVLEEALGIATERGLLDACNNS